MTKRIMTMLIVLALAFGGSSALAETTATETTVTTQATMTVEEAEAIEGKTRYVTASPCLNIRVSADLEAEIVTTRHFNHTVKVIGEEGQWSHVLIVRGDQVFEGYCWTDCLSDQKVVVKKTVKKIEEEDSSDPHPVVDGSKRYPGIGYEKWEDGNWHYDSALENAIQTGISKGRPFNKETGEFEDVN